MRKSCDERNTPATRQRTASAHSIKSTPASGISPVRTLGSCTTVRDCVCGAQSTGKLAALWRSPNRIRRRSLRAAPVSVCRGTTCVRAPKALPAAAAALAAAAARCSASAC
eukprot:473877-Prymnesium_polylepis.1